MELLYHVNEKDDVLGSIERDRAHADGLLHRSGIVFLVRSNGQILLQVRSPLKRIFPNRHECSCAFHVAFGESYEEAAKRELREETGISAVTVLIGKFLHHDPPEHQIVACYLSRSDDPVVIDPREAASSSFCSPEEVDRIVASELVTPWLRDGWRLVRKLSPLE